MQVCRLFFICEVINGIVHRSYIIKEEASVKNLMAILLIVVLVVMFATIEVTAGFEKNYVIHYSFDKDSGNAIKDLSGNDNNGTGYSFF